MVVYCKNTKDQLATFLSNGSLCVVEIPLIETWEELNGKEFNVEELEDKPSKRWVLALLYVLLINKLHTYNFLGGKSKNMLLV